MERRPSCQAATLARGPVCGARAAAPGHLPAPRAGSARVLPGRAGEAALGSPSRERDIPGARGERVAAQGAVTPRRDAPVVAAHRRGAGPGARQLR